MPALQTGYIKILGAFDDDVQEVETTYRAYHEPTSAGQERGFRCAQGAK